jgi:hypothetical protein
MKIIEHNNNSTFYADADGYYLNSRCNWGAAEPTAEFKLISSEIELYIKNGNSIIHEWSRLADSPASKELFERERPISNEKRLDICKCDQM